MTAALPALPAMLPMPVGPRLREALQWARQRWAGVAVAAFLRLPAEDPECPDLHDLDLMLFGPVRGFIPQRAWSPSGVAVDLAWYPEGWLAQPERIAAAGLAAHRLASSARLWGDSTAARACRPAVEACMGRPDLQAARLSVFLDMARLAVRETGITQDLPSLARLWLQMAASAAVGALADSHGLICPNVYTRPFVTLDAIEQAVGLDLRGALQPAFALHDDLPAVAAGLQRMLGEVERGFADPAWPPAMREATRAEFAYSASRLELDWRLAVAREMASRGGTAAALWMLRFWAWTLARLPMVWQAAAEGRDIAFLRPERAVRPALQALCPALLCDFDLALGGPVDGAALARAHDAVQALRELLVQRLQASAGPGLAVAPWQAHRPAGTPAPPHGALVA